MKIRYKIKLKQESSDGYNFLSGDSGDEDDNEKWGWSKEGHALIFDYEKAKSIQSMIDFETELIKA